MKTSLVAVTLLAASLHAQQVVYPLHVGDRWQYTIMVVPPDTSYPGPSSRVTGDTIMPGGKTYAVMLWQGYGNSQEYERQIGDSVFEYDSVIKGEFLMFDFTRRPGDTVASVLRGMDTMDIVLNSFYSGPPRTWWFHVNPQRHSVDEDYGVGVQDSMGVVSKRPSFGDPMDLTGAVIDGRVYGTIAGLQSYAGQTPQKFVLEQNYPNPFNPSTTIRYSLPQRTLVELAIFNTLGQKVATLVDATEDPGTYSVRFEGRGIASGVYIYRLHAEGYTEAKRLVVLR